MARALITGVGGQDGVLLSASLVEHGWDVIGTVRGDEEASQSNLDGLQILRADLLDLGGLGEVVDRADPDAVVNLAGVSSVATSWRTPVETAVANGAAVGALLDACLRRTGAGRPTRFVQASSAEIFGRAETSPQNERTPIAPVNPYGASKAFAHQLVSVFRSQGLVASSAILFNHESVLRPDTFVTRKISKQVARIALGHADRLELGDLDARRDWSAAEDVVDGVRLILEQEERGDDWVIASGESHSVRDFVATAFGIVGISDWAPFVTSSPDLIRPREASEQRGDSSRIRSELGWTPATDFPTLVRAMVEADLASESAAASS